MRTDRFKIRAHISRSLNDSELIIPTFGFDIIPKKILNRMARGSNWTSGETILIENHDRDFRRLSDSIDEGIEQINHQNKFEEIHYDHISHKWLTWFNVIIFFIVFGILLTCIQCIWNKLKFITKGYGALF